MCDFEKWNQEDKIVERLVWDKYVQDDPHHITTETENIIERMDVDDFIFLHLYQGW